MSAALAHRGPDGHGLWLDQGFALFHRRLAIIDLSAAGQQPMRSASGRYLVSFNGEIYNYLELRRELEGASSSVRWRGTSDTEVLANALDRWGVEGTLKKLNGMFAVAIWDRSKRALFLARDRFGEKPLYYGWLGPHFVFASELKALRCSPHWRGVIDPAALELYTRFAYVPTPLSIYKGIFKLPPAHYLHLKTEDLPGVEVAPRCYWPFAKHVIAGQKRGGGTVRTTEDLSSELHDRLQEAVQLRMVSDVPLGAFLSGGIDSTTIVALMQKTSSRAVKTYSIGFFEQAYDEAKYARAVAKHLGTDHTELYVTAAEAQRLIPQIPSIYDEPFADSSQIPSVLVSKLARQFVTVAITGDGGDEMFGGYNRYLWGRRAWGVLETTPSFARSITARLIRSVPESLFDEMARRLGRVAPSLFNLMTFGEKLHKLASVMGAESRHDLYRELTSFWRDHSPLSSEGRGEALIREDIDPNEEELSYSRQMMTLDALTYLPDDILTKVDRASMAVGLEARAPFLDHHLAVFGASVPDAALFQHGQGKYIVRQVLAKYVPQRLTERPKHGFGMPVGDWIRTSLRDWAEDLLSEASLRESGLFNDRVVRRDWQAHVSGQRNVQHDLWIVLMFQQWLRDERLAVSKS